MDKCNDCGGILKGLPEKGEFACICHLNSDKKKQKAKKDLNQQEIHWKNGRETHNR
jgi:hypothetical protein